MRTDGNISKVAICDKCKGFVLAAHIDHLTRKTEREFTELTNDGFTVKIETAEETRSRKYADYTKCVSGDCN